MDEELIVGIDLGTTHSLVAVVDSGFPIVLADEEGRRMLPSAVSFRVEDPPLVGNEALRARALSPERTIVSIKRILGRRWSELSPAEVESSPYPLADDGNGYPGIPLPNGETVGPVEVSAEILRRLKRTAELALGTEVRRAVVTVPAYFNNMQREATKTAADQAGLEVARIINEPTAAALAYGLDKLEENSTVAVYDLGGGTFDLSVLKMTDGFFEVVATAGDTRLGGDDIDAAIAEALRKQWDLGELSLEERAVLLSAARTAKEESSAKRDGIEVRLPFFRGNQSYEHRFSADEIEALAAPIIDRTLPICRRAFAEAAAKGSDQIDRIVLVGGSTRLPLVPACVSEWFGLEPDQSQHPDEAVALGAAIQAGLLCGRVREMTLVDVTPLSLGIETFGGLMNVIVPRNSTIPAKAGEMFTNAVADQPSMAIRILQGEREMARDNWLLGEIEVPFSPGPKGSARVGVQFSIDRDGILEVLARDTATGIDHLLEIRDAAVDVDDAAVGRMVGESVEHAFADMNERIWTEASLKSEELLAAVDLALEQVGEEIDPEERENISRCTETVRRQLERAEAGERDASALKSANAALDDATQHLAALLVEKAFADEF